MAIQFHPHAGTVLMCNFDTGFKEPEMVKVRPVVVVSPRRRSGPPLCTVVPLSTTRPEPVEAHHHLLEPASLPSRLVKNENWAKGDMLYTVCLDRLDRVKAGRGADGTRLYVAQRVTDADLAAIHRCIAAALGLALAPP